MAVTRWWGDFELADGESGCWRVGPMTLRATNLGREWVLSHKAGDDPLAPEVELRVPDHGGDDAIPGEPQRFCFSAPHRRIRLIPRLADRPVVSHPQTKLQIPAGQEIQLFIGSPVWVAVDVGRTPVSLGEFPLYRASDTWFGPVTEAGGLSYAAATRAVSDVSMLSGAPARAVTPVLVRNRAKTALAIERINLPVPYLSLYQAEDNRLWTDAVTMQRDEGQEETARVQMEKRPPREAGAGILLSEPRESSDKGLMVHAFNALFG